MYTRDYYARILDECANLVKQEGNVDIEVRDAVAIFAEEMERTLRENDHKAGWHECPDIYLISRLKQEVLELCEALSGPSTDRRHILKEATDVANFAMMIADNYCDLEGME